MFFPSSIRVSCKCSHPIPSKTSEATSDSVDRHGRRLPQSCFSFSQNSSLHAGRAGLRFSWWQPESQAGHCVGIKTYENYPMIPIIPIKLREYWLWNGVKIYEMGLAQDFWLPPLSWQLGFAISEDHTAYIYREYENHPVIKEYYIRYIYILKPSNSNARFGE
jgi:hypothetical protein